jgi:hypothetical protein
MTLKYNLCPRSYWEGEIVKNVILVTAFTLLVGGSRAQGLQTGDGELNQFNFFNLSVEKNEVALVIPYRTLGCVLQFRADHPNLSFFKDLADQIEVTQMNRMNGQTLGPLKPEYSSWELKYALLETNTGFDHLISIRSMLQKTLLELTNRSELGVKQVVVTLKECTERSE